MNASAYGFLAGLGQKISAISGDDRKTCYLFQRISVLIQRFNAQHKTKQYCLSLYKQFSGSNSHIHAACNPRNALPVHYLLQPHASVSL